jgi:hypothetical protein
MSGPPPAAQRAQELAAAIGDGSHPIPVEDPEKLQARLGEAAAELRLWQGVDDDKAHRLAYAVGWAQQVVGTLQRTGQLTLTIRRVA